MREAAEESGMPRALYVHWPFGHALGEPGNAAQQRSILRDAFQVARDAPEPGLVVELPYRWRREAYPEIVDWSTPSSVVAAALERARAAKAERQRLAPVAANRRSGPMERLALRLMWRPGELRLAVAAGAAGAALLALALLRRLGRSR